MGAKFAFRLSHKTSLCVTTALFATAWWAAANAQQALAAQQNGANLQTVVVTAQKRTQNLQKTAATVTAISATQLVEQGINDTRALQNVVPSLVTDKAGDDVQFFLRGIGQTSEAVGDDAGVALNVNGIYTPREASAGSFYDMADVEVLYGPQGTLYGRNSAGGTVNVNTKQPTDKFELDGLEEVGNYGMIHTSEALNIPITDDLKVRAAIDYNRHNGYLSDGLESQNALGGRGTVLYTPTSYLSILMIGSFYHNTGLGTAVQNIPPPDTSNPWYYPQRTAVGDFNNNNKIVTGSANVTLHLPAGLALTYIPGYIYNNGDVAETGTNPFLSYKHSSNKEISQELRLAQSNQRLQWTIGLYDLRNTLFADNLFTTPIVDPHVLSYTGPLDSTTKSYAAFGEATYSVLPTFRVTGGLRYSSDVRAGHGILSTIAGGADHSTYFSATEPVHKIDYKIGVEYDIAPQSMVYANVRTGFIDGGFNTITSTLQFNTFKPETVIAYTGGIKNRFLDNQLEVNDEIFYYDYKNYQVTSVDNANGTNIFYNTQKATIYGNDLQLRYLLTPSDQFNIGLSYLSAVATTLLLPPATVGGPEINYSAYTLPDSPAWSATLGYQHTWLFNSGATLQGFVSSRLQTSSWGEYNHAYGTDAPGFTTTDATLTYAPPTQNWTVGAWVRNIENTAYYQAITAGGVPGPAGGFISPPRTFGLRFTFKLGV